MSGQAFYTAVPVHATPVDNLLIRRERNTGIHSRGGVKDPPVSSQTSSLYAVSSSSLIRPTTVVSSANLIMALEP